VNAPVVWSPGVAAPPRCVPLEAQPARRKLINAIKVASRFMRSFRQLSSRRAFLQRDFLPVLSGVSTEGKSGKRAALFGLPHKKSRLSFQVGGFW
jgi:hypothetical protein